MTLPQSAHELVELLGATDQQFLTDPTPELAMLRAQLRQRLADYSVQRGEQSYLLSEAVILLETARMEVEDVPLHTMLSSHLADVYLQFYRLTHETKYLIVVGQILRPLSTINDPQIFLGLARMDAALNKPALTQHWLTRLMRFASISLADWIDAPEFAAFRQEDWFVQMKQQYLH